MAVAELAHERFRADLANEIFRLVRTAKFDELASEMRGVGLVAIQAKTEIHLIHSYGHSCRAGPASSPSLTACRTFWFPAVLPAVAVRP